MEIPESLCFIHWAEWWVDGFEPITKKQRQLLTKETLDNMKEQNGRTER